MLLCDVPKIIVVPFVKKLYDNHSKVSDIQRNKSAITCKSFFRRKSIFLSKLDLSKAIT